MKDRLAIVLLTAGILAAACNFTLAQDITPPPGYIPPTLAPTLGPLYPPTAPSIENGAAIFMQKCAPCHGETGLGDGEQGKQLPVTVAAFALPETARKASPARWFTVVTQGNLDRFMPPFTSLTEQERWDVVAYALTLHTNPETLQLGRTLFESKCGKCGESFFADQEQMAALSNEDLARIITEGNEQVPAFAQDLTEDEVWAVTEYVRTRTFSASFAAATPALASQTPVSSEVATPLAQGTLPAQSATALSPNLGAVRGSIENKTGTALPTDLVVRLLAYEHQSDPSTGPQEIFSLEGAVEADGAFAFDNVEIPESRIFIAEVTFEGLEYQSEFAVVEAGASDVVLPSLTVYPTTTEFSGLTVDSLQIFFDYANEDSVQLFYVYQLLNTGGETIVVDLAGPEQVPFISFPAGAQSLGYEETQDSAGFVATASGIAIPPSETAYGLIAFASMPRDKRIEISQQLMLPIQAATLFLPEGVGASGEGLTGEGIQQIQNTNFNIFTVGALQAGDTLAFTLSGLPKDTANTADLTQNQTLIIGAAALGAALILAGVWMYVRERNRVDGDIDNEGGDEEDPEELMDAIVALDDLHRAGKITAEVYQKRRAELKSRLRGGL